MAKRVRGSRSAHRPGGQGPSRTRKTADASTSVAGDVSETTASTDIDSAVEAVEAIGTGGLVEMEYTEIAIAEPAPATPKPRRRGRRGGKAKASDLQALAVTESTYVREDLRRIGVVSLILVIGLAIAWVLFAPLNLLGLY